MAFRPTNASGQGTVEGLRNYNRFTREYVNDRPVIELFNLLNMTEHDPDNLQGAGAGAPELGEVSTSEICGVLIAASNDAYGHLLVLPYWLSTKSQIDFRVLWSNSEAAATGSLTAAVKYTPIDISAQSVALAVGATALDTAIAAQVDLAANVPQWTQWGSINADKAGVKDLDPGTDLLALTIIGTLTTIGNASFLSAQMRAYRNQL